MQTIKAELQNKGNQILGQILSWIVELDECYQMTTCPDDRNWTRRDWAKANPGLSAILKGHDAGLYEAHAIIGIYYDYCQALPLFNEFEMLNLLQTIDRHIRRALQIGRPKEECRDIYKFFLVAIKNHYDPPPSPKQLAEQKKREEAAFKAARIKEAQQELEWAKEQKARLEAFLAKNNK